MQHVKASQEENFLHLHGNGDGIEGVLFAFSTWKAPIDRM